MLTLLKRYPLWSFFVLAFLLTSIVELMGFLFFKGSLLVGWISIFMPAVSALFLTGLNSGKAGVQDLISRMFTWRCGVQWYLASVYYPFFFRQPAWYLLSLVFIVGVIVLIFGWRRMVREK
jgi:hypothetical protein